MKMTNENTIPLFHLGQVVSTPAILEVCTREHIGQCLRRHVSGDWGVCNSEDKATNDDAVKYGNRIFSAYPIDPTQPSKGYGDNTLWIITERDRSVTTLLLPSEY